MKNNDIRMGILNGSRITKNGREREKKIPEGQNG